jgi:hypothetical protein
MALADTSQQHDQDVAAPEADGGPALRLRHRGFVAPQAGVGAVTLFPAWLPPADEGLLGIGAVAEEDIEEVVIGPTNDVGAHGPVLPQAGPS